MTVRERLVHACAAVGGQRAWARMHSVSPSYVSAVLAGDAEPGPKILEVLGLRRDEPTYRPVEEPTDADQ
ncbi:hypothetical protein [Methylobacterium sp. B1]|uniref:hypothetical protein n=1 Tax=Methylobacterium sp. B1 TaxID=91459 RepID=UPI00034B76F6|nr:hypothetical protein [Methylobacterium sp. B1]